MKKLTKIFCLLMCMLTCQFIFAQTTDGNKYEIKIFKKNNKALLKTLKNQYKSKVDVEQNEDGVFYIVIKIETDGSTRYLLADEVGTLLYPDMIDSYQAGKDYLWLGQQQNGSMKLGAIDMKGKSILPIKYSKIHFVKEAEAGVHSGIWHPTNEEVFVVVEEKEGETINMFISCKDNKILYTYKGEASNEQGYFWKIKTKVSKNLSVADGSKNTSNDISIVSNNLAIYESRGWNNYYYGLYTNDGKEILPPEYDDFVFESSTGLIKTKKNNGEVVLYGAKMIKPGLTTVVVPALFNDVRWNSSINNYECRVHRGDPYVAYDAMATYDFSYKDDGEKLYDGGKFQDVITFYEGEGFGKVWGNYYMGLAANEIAKKEVAKMDYVINTLNSSNSYYLPLEYPNKYKYDAGIIMTMYLSAISYLEKYISSDEVSNDDPTKIEARKLRGELVTIKNNFTKKTDDYTTAYTNAMRKNAERKAIQVQQQIQQERAAKAIVDGIFNLLK